MDRLDDMLAKAGTLESVLNWAEELQESSLRENNKGDDEWTVVARKQKTAVGMPTI